MLGSTPIQSVLGSGVDNTDHDAVRAFIKQACGIGLSLLLIHPGTKQPTDMRTTRQRNTADKVAREAAREAGRRDWERVKSPSGLALASTDSKVVLKYLDEYIRTYGDECAVNIAAEVGGSRVVVVDCDTAAQVARFLEVAEIDEPIPPTVSTPGVFKADITSPEGEAGTWLHSDGGHFWFTVPDDVELPDNLGALTWGGDDGFAVLWRQRYVLIPPSTRPEGPYELTGRDYEIPEWLVEAIQQVATVRAERHVERAERDPDDDDATAIDAWAESTSWSDILEPLGWTPTARSDNCGCAVWTAPGDHASPKSATAHDSGCGLGRYTEVNAPLHLWTDNPGEPFDAYVAEKHTQTISKLQAVSWITYGGNVGAAMDALGLLPDLSISGEDGNDANQSDVSASDDPDMGDFELPTPIEITSDERPTPFDGPGPFGEPGATPFDDPETPQESAAGSETPSSKIASTTPTTIFDNPPTSVTVTESDPTPFADDVDAPDPDVFDCGIAGVPRMAPFSYWRDMPPPEYIIEGLIEHGGLSCIIGPPNVGKSTVVLDMACHIATGRSWQGRKTLKTRVLYLAGEGLSGAIQRVEAWCQSHDVDLENNLILGDSIIQLGAAKEAWGAVSEYILRQQIGLIIFDTFARMSLGVEENSATEVGKAVRRFDKLRELTSAGVLVVHHTAKGNATSARGSSALNGALDSEVLISDATWDTVDVPTTGTGDGARMIGKPIQLTTTKQKNAEQVTDPIPMLMINYEPVNAALITGPTGSVDSDPFEAIMARPLPEPIVELAIRIRRFIDNFPQQGATRTEIANGVEMDPYTRGRKDAARFYKQRVAMAVDAALRYELIETLTGTPSGARYIPSTATIESARTANAAEIIDNTDE